MEKICRVGARVLIVVLSGLFGMMLAEPAFALSYNRDAAISYAHKYACNGQACHNSAYVYFKDHNCTNFVSQALYRGGFPQERHSSYDLSAPEWFYNTSTDAHSKAWSSVEYFIRYWAIQHSYAASQTAASSMGAKYTTATPGDLYVYDWGQGNGFSHLSMSTGYGTFANYYDPGKKKNYRAITGGSGDYITQNSTDRDYAPWNWGYQTEANPTVKARMRTLVFHYKL